MKSDINQTGRICLYDNIRFVLITLVVVGHCTHIGTDVSGGVARI